MDEFDDISQNITDFVIFATAVRAANPMAEFTPKELDHYFTDYLNNRGLKED